MANTVVDALREIQAEVASIPGIRRAPQYIEDGAPPFPFVFAYPINGDLKYAPARTMTGLHNIVLEFHVARKDLARDVEKAFPYIDSIPKKIMQALQERRFSTINTFGGTETNISYEFGPLAWAGQETIGFIFTINNVKLQAEVST